MLTECPICKKMVSCANPCEHFLGYTDDGQSISEAVRPEYQNTFLCEHFILQKTGVSCRVFTPVIY